MANRFSAAQGFRVKKSIFFISQKFVPVFLLSPGVIVINLPSNDHLKVILPRQEQMLDKRNSLKVHLWRKCEEYPLPPNHHSRKLVFF